MISPFGPVKKNSNLWWVMLLIPSKQSCHARLSGHLQLELVLGAGAQLRSTKKWMVWCTKQPESIHGLLKWMVWCTSDALSKKNDAKIDGVLKNVASWIWTLAKLCLGRLWRSSWISENYTATPGKAKQMPPWSRCCPCEPRTVVASELIKVTFQNLLVGWEQSPLCAYSLMWET